MCAGREHRYRVSVDLSLPGGVRKKQDICVYAKGVTDAIAKVDGIYHKENPGLSFITMTVTHSGYSTDESAVEHGAILPTT